MSGFDIDEFVTQATEGLKQGQSARKPVSGDLATRLVQGLVQQRSHDQDVADRKDRLSKPKIRYQDGVVEPPVAVKPRKRLFRRKP